MSQCVRRRVVRLLGSAAARPAGQGLGRPEIDMDVEMARWITAMLMRDVHPPGTWSPAKVVCAIWGSWSCTGQPPCAFPGLRAQAQRGLGAMALSKWASEASKSQSSWIFCPCSDPSAADRGSGNREGTERRQDMRLEVANCAAPRWALSWPDGAQRRGICHQPPSLIGGPTLSRSFPPCKP